MWNSFLLAFALCVLAVQSEAEDFTIREPTNRIMEPKRTKDSLDSTTASSEYFVPKQLMQILLRKWSTIMKKFNSISQTDGLSDIDIIRRRELGIVA